MRYIRALQKFQTRFTVTYTLEALRATKDSLIAVIFRDGGIRTQQRHDPIVIDYGTAGR